jgi:hypothetical protein
MYNRCPETADLQERRYDRIQQDTDNHWDNDCVPRKSFIMDSLHT